MIRKILITIAAGIFFIINSCGENITSPTSFGEELCYAKVINGNWEIVINNSGNVKNISNTNSEDNYPEWSPDGKYIIYQHITSNIETDIYCYDIKKDSTINLTSDAESYFAITPIWTPDGQKIVYGYHQIGMPYYIYIMDKDGSNKRKIIEQDADIYSYPRIYFYDDSYTFIYIVDNKKIYKNNIDNTGNEFLFDIYQELNSNGNDLTIRDFNPITEDFVITKVNSDSLLEIMTYNIKTRELATIVSSGEGYNLVFKCFSKDYSKFAFTGNKAKTFDKEYLSVYENGVERRLVELDVYGNDNKETFSYNPMRFSPIGSNLAFSRIIWGSSGGMITQENYLYIVDSSNGNVKVIDTGQHPSWKP
jgi:dipeptidyl aminopeptidase/acylaminoacyl peptidase